VLARTRGEKRFDASRIREQAKVELHREDMANRDLKDRRRLERINEVRERERGMLNRGRGKAGEELRSRDGLKKGGRGDGEKDGSNLG